MSFSQADITGVNPPVQFGTELLLSWTSTATAGTVFQVYLDQQLAWSGVGLDLPQARLAAEPHITLRVSSSVSNMGTG
jgi:hypothetical protein